MSARMSNRRAIPSENSTHHHFQQNTETCSNTFLGISGRPTEASIFLRIDKEPLALASVCVKPLGGLFSNSIYMEKLGIEKVVTPVLGQAEKVLLALGFGSTHSIFRVSAVDAQVLVVGENVWSETDRASFPAIFAERMQTVYDNSNLLRRLAGMPADAFDDAWFHRRIQPDPEHLQAIRSVMALAVALDKSNAVLTVDGDPVDLPDCKSWKTVKWGGALRDVVGTLVGLAAHPPRVEVIVGRSTKVSLRAADDGYITKLNSNMRVGDLVRFSYAPLVDLLQPFEAYPSKGRLLEIDLA